MLACFDDAGNPLTDAALIAKIMEYNKVCQELAKPGGIAVIAGEGRRVEYTQGSAGACNAILRDLLTCARGRGLAIGGNVGALTVEVGHRGC